MKSLHLCVIADTHIKKFTTIPEDLEKVIKKADLILHLGDFTSPDLFEYLKGLNNFYGIAGNHDPHCIKSLLPKTDVIEINGKRLGLLHGYWFPLFCQHRSLARFQHEKIDAIIYGHTHIVRNEIANNILFFNPGSASALWPAPWKTYGILDIGDTINGEIRFLGKKQENSIEKCFDKLITREQIIRIICGKNRLHTAGKESLYY